MRNHNHPGHAPPTRLRCAIYTRKSTEEGLEQDFSSLDAQREAAEAFIQSQRREGWIRLPERYDDGGFTGANMDRPALQQLLAAVAAGELDCVVVYKVDRLSRSLIDFTRILSLFEKYHVSFVSWSCGVLAIRSNHTARFSWFIKIPVILSLHRSHGLLALGQFNGSIFAFAPPQSVGGRVSEFSRCSCRHSAHRCGDIGGNPHRKRAASQRARKRRTAALASAGPRADVYSSFFAPESAQNGGFHRRNPNCLKQNNFPCAFVPARSTFQSHCSRSVCGGYWIHRVILRKFMPVFLTIIEACALGRRPMRRSDHGILPTGKIRYYPVNFAFCSPFRAADGTGAPTGNS